MSAHSLFISSLVVTLFLLLFLKQKPSAFLPLLFILLFLSHTVKATILRPWFSSFIIFLFLCLLSPSGVSLSVFVALIRFFCVSFPFISPFWSSAPRPHLCENMLIQSKCCGLNCCCRGTCLRSLLPRVC